MATHEVHCSHDMPISQCIEHWVEFCAIVGDTIELRALRWAFGDDTGTSSETLAAFMLGIPKDGWQSPPSDAADRGRCIRLLRLIPEWLPRLPELAAANPGAPGRMPGVSPKQAGKEVWSYQIKLMLQEGNF